MAVENPAFSLAESRRTHSKLTPVEISENKTLAREIATFASANPRQSRYEAMPDGHLRTYTLGEEDYYDHERRTTSRVLTVSVDETRRQRNIHGNEEEITGKIIIGPYQPPRTRIEVKEKDANGGIGTTTSSHQSTPTELSAVLQGLTTGSLTDPRVTNWREIYA